MIYTYHCHWTIYKRLHWPDTHHVYCWEIVHLIIYFFNQILVQVTWWGCSKYWGFQWEVSLWYMMKQNQKNKHRENNSNLLQDNWQAEVTKNSTSIYVWHFVMCCPFSWGGECGGLEGPTTWCWYILTKPPPCISSSSPLLRRNPGTSLLFIYYVTQAAPI